MRRQINILQTKEQDKNSQDQINEQERGKEPEKTIQNNDGKDDAKSPKYN